MNWKTKAHILAILSRVRGGERLYHLLQRVARTNRLDVAESVGRCVNVVELAREAGTDPPFGTIVEIGTGWRPFLPFILSLLGAERVITFDIHPWLTNHYALETYRALDAQLEVLAGLLRLDGRLLRSRFEATRAKATGMRPLLEAFRVDYRCPADASKSGLPNASVDVVCSSNVLEHVPPEVLGRIHAESARILRPGGIAVHRFNPGDHFAAVDKRITVANFVQFPQPKWHWYGGSGLGYHNRLRCPVHARLLEEAGLEIVVNRVRGNARAVEAIESRQLPVHPDFMKFTPHELAADYMWLVGQRPPCSAPARRTAPAAATAVSPTGGNATV